MSKKGPKVDTNWFCDRIWIEWTHTYFGGECDVRRRNNGWSSAATTGLPNSWLLFCTKVALRTNPLNTVCNSINWMVFCLLLQKTTTINQYTVKIHNRHILLPFSGVPVHDRQQQRRLWPWTSGSDFAHKPVWVRWCTIHLTNFVSWLRTIFLTLWPFTHKSWPLRLVGITWHA